MANKVVNSDELALDSSDYFGPDEKAASRERSVAILRLLWSRRRFISRFVVVGLIVSAGISFLIPNRYESTALLMPPDQGGSGLAALAAAATGEKSGSGSSGGSLGNMPPGLGAIASDALGLKASSDLYLGILQSRTVEDDVINQFDLRKLYSDKYFEDARKDLEKNTSLSSDRKTGIITVKVSDKNPKRASEMTQKYVDELNSAVARVNTSAAHREREFLEQRLSEVRQDLATAEKEFSQFSSKNNAIDIPSQGKAMIEAGASLQGELIAAETELQALKQIYADQNVRVRSVQAKVNELRKQAQKLLGNGDVSASAPPASGETSYPTIRALPLLGVNYADLYRNSKIQEVIFGNLTQQYELAKVQEAKETPTVKVLDFPDVPEKKSFPPRLVLIILGSLLALATGTSWVLGDAAWQSVDAMDPRKLFAKELVVSVRNSLPHISRNGTLPQLEEGKPHERSESIEE